MIEEEKLMTSETGAERYTQLNIFSPMLLDPPVLKEPKISKSAVRMPKTRVKVLICSLLRVFISWSISKLLSQKLCQNRKVPYLTRNAP